MTESDFVGMNIVEGLVMKLGRVQRRQQRRYKLMLNNYYDRARSFVFSITPYGCCSDNVQKLLWLCTVKAKKG